MNGLKKLRVKGRKGLVITISHSEPEKFLLDKSLYELKGEELKQAKKKPFYTDLTLTYVIKYKGKRHVFSIAKGYDWNGANVPPFAWLIIGQRTDPRFKLASCVHDYLCENKGVIENDRYLSTLIFETLCEHFGKFNAFKRWAMFHSVDNFQKTQKWKRGKV